MFLIRPSCIQHHSAYRPRLHWKHLALKSYVFKFIMQAMIIGVTWAWRKNLYELGILVQNSRSKQAGSKPEKNTRDIKFDITKKKQSIAREGQNTKIQNSIASKRVNAINARQGNTQRID